MTYTDHPELKGHRSMGQSIVRRFIVPLVFLVGLYGLVRYAVTGEGATDGSFTQQAEVDPSH